MTKSKTEVEIVETLQMNGPTKQINVPTKKRGRKSKKEMQEINEKLQKSISDSSICNSISDNSVTDNSVTDNIIVSIEENVDCHNELLQYENKIDHDVLTKESKPVGKKRGRKPKGGKIIQQIVSLNNNKEVKPNIILHLKCSLKDLQNNVTLGNIECFNFSSKNDMTYEIISTSDNNLIQNNIDVNKGNNYEIDDDDTSYDLDEDIKTKDIEIKEVWKKLKSLEHNLHINNICDKKSACFWCTCDFDNPPVYIPKHYINESYHVYGCFCSPECAAAHLMEENIDSSSKFERYHLINHIYAKVYDYKKNIKPAPNPYYMLDKYYGNLSIQEFRSLLRNERLFLIVDKPLTRILPELHEDNDDFIINNKIIPSNTYQIKKKLNRKHQSKNNILNEKFGITSQ